jgi:phage baseplate assembly protein gpV
VTDTVQVLRAIIRDELARRHGPELGIVTAVQPRDSAGSENNHQVNVRLRETGIELQHVPVAVSRLGLSMMPRIDDLVLVLFLGGDLNAPVVVGSVYHENLQPPVGKAAEMVYMPADPDDSSLRRIHFELGNGSLITVDDDKLTVQLAGTEIVIQRDGDVTLKGAGKLEVKTQSDIRIESGGNLELKAQGNVKINGVAVTVEGSGNAKLKAPALSLAGNTQFSAS